MKGFNLEVNRAEVESLVALYNAVSEVELPDGVFILIDWFLERGIVKANQDGTLYPIWWRH